MANIKKIECRVKTGNRSRAGTDGHIFLALGGREFRLDSMADDYESGSDRTYIMGEGAGEGSTITDKTLNDPRSPVQLHTEDLDKSPAYIRFEPEKDSDRWDLEAVTATVNPGPKQIRYRALWGSGHLWLGEDAGKYCYLTRMGD